MVRTLKTDILFLLQCFDTEYFVDKSNNIFK